MIKRIAMVLMGCLLLGPGLVSAEDGPPPLPGDVPGTAIAQPAPKPQAKPSKVEQRKQLKGKAVKGKRQVAQASKRKAGQAKVGKSVKRPAVAKKAGKKRR
ncbi:hypothetical protein HNQ59_001087 [Chitinivorax tropicus]|uniref:Cell envelope biogenesis protein TolA n=1 Tax=Chitinivorax tropicus TaxID=714531 RepID=A0A840MLP7_9PROT|nr:hypothetical protein [Chitinivorax tropicus]MBB5017817.1 hypothetical protein [Chitinivorax tropicus]